jgi:hypothetical protein
MLYGTSFHVCIETPSGDVATLDAVGELLSSTCLPADQDATLNLTQASNITNTQPSYSQPSGWES